MAVKLREITIAHSPDSDDAFMFYALAKEKLGIPDLRIHQVLKDIQSLNQEAISGTYEVSAISFAAYPLVAKQYALMPCGASMGNKYGPMLIARQPIDTNSLDKTTIAIPGKLTTAFLALNLFRKGLKVIEMPFDQIMPAVASGDVEAGLIIHEGQLTYSSLGLTKIVDLGQWWFELTGLPLPLGGNVIRRDLGSEQIKQITKLLKEAIVYSLNHRQEALEYALTFARDMQPSLADQFIGMYVNELTVDYGEVGRKAVSTLFSMAYEQGLVSEPVPIDFVEI